MPNASGTVSDRSVYLSIVICLSMILAPILLPAQLGAMALGYNLSPGQLSLLVSVELGVYVLSTIFCSTLSLSDYRRWLPVGCLTVIAANLALAFFAPQLPFLPARAVAGLGAGFGFGYALKMCALSQKPAQNFGILTGSMAVLMIAGVQGMAQLTAAQTATGVTEAEGARNVATIIFVVYAAMAAFAAVIFLFNRPASVKLGDTAIAGARGLLGPLAILGLTALLIMFMGQGAVWAFLQTLGVSHGYAVGDVANAMSVFAIMGIVGSFSVALLPKALPTSSAIGLAFVILLAGLFALYAPASISWYVAGSGICGFFWSFAMPQVLGLLARIDPTGRASILGGSMASTGAALGPLAAGALIHGANYQPVGWMVAGFCLFSLACLWFVEFKDSAARVAVAP
jgi:predicted MFS family arabinose efflux permease